MHESFPERLRRLRERKNVKQYIMSELCGLNQNAIRRFELGERVPRADALEAMADYLGVTMDELWRGRDTTKKYNPITKGKFDYEHD